MADLVNEMLAKFTEMSQEEKQISAETDAAFKEYNDYCASSDTDLSKKISEIRAKMSKLDYLMQYAREHAQPDGLEEAAAPFETSDGTLESIRQTIKLDSHNDPNAESLYTKASGQKLFYEQEIERTRNLIEGSKVQAKRQYDSDVAALNDRKEKHDAAVKAYIQSGDFQEYLKLLSSDKSAFNSPGIVNLTDKSAVSIGQRRVKLSVPMEVEQDLSVMSNGEYNSAARTIGAPFQITMQKGGVMYLDFDERNQAYLLGGIQRLLLNIIKYFGQDISDMFFCDPVGFNPDCLGHIAALGKGINPFIAVPQSMHDAELMLSELAAKTEENPAPDKVSRVIVLHSFPENYKDELKERVLALCKNAERSGALVVLTHNSAAQESDVEKEIRGAAVSIRSRNGGFWIEQSRESLFWYSAPSDIPEEIRRVYVDQRRQQAAKPANAPTVAEPVNIVVQRTSSAASEPVSAVVQQSAPAAPEPASVEVKQPEPPVPEPVSEAVYQPEPQVYEPAAPEKEAHAAEPDEPANEISEENESAEEPAPAEKPAAVKGSRVLPNIVIGRNGSLDISGNVTYICGSRGEERRMIVGSIISGIIAGTHPDDAELWLFDCGGGELARYAEDAPAHIRYAVADCCAETSLDFADVVSRELDKRVAEFKTNGWSDISSVPSGEFMPRIAAVVNEFPKLYENVVNAPKYFGRNYMSKLKKLFAKCADYGIHFVLVGETFSDNGRRPECFGENSVGCAATVGGKDDAAILLGGLIGNKPGEFEQLRKLPVGCAFTACGGSGGLVRLSAQTAENTAEYVSVPEYSDSVEEYVDKRTLIADRTAPISYAERHEMRSAQILSRDTNETLLFLGEPCRFTAEHPLRMFDDFGENVLAIVPEREKSGAVSAVTAALLSLSEQGIPAEILASRANPVYAELLRCEKLDGVHIFEGDKAAARIKELSAEIGSGQHPGTFEIVLGGDLLLASMYADESAGELKRALVKGPRLGLHFMFVAGSTAQLGSGFVSLFRHRLVFACPLAEAEKLLHDPNCDMPENAFRLSGDYDEVSVMPYRV